MEIIAKLKHFRMAPRKARLVADLIKGMDINKARAQLKFIPKKASGFLLKLLNSAVANAKHNFNLKEENLYISKILVDSGPSLKRWMPRAMGRATPILKRTCHITLVLNRRKSLSVETAKDRITKDLSSESLAKDEKKIGEPEKIIEKEMSAQKEEKVIKKIPPQKPFASSGVAKKRFFSRQAFGNFKRDIKKLFRRKSV